MIVPGTSASPSPDQPAAAPVDPAPLRPSPQEGVLPETVQQSPLEGSDHFSPDESPAPQEAPKPGEWDVFKAKLELAAIDSPTATLGRQFMEPTGPSLTEIAKGGVTPDFISPSKLKLTPEQANQLYPGMPKPFDEPIDPDTAERVAAVQKRRNDLRDIIVQGPAVGRGVDALVGAAAGALAGSPSGLPGAIGGAVAGGTFAALAGSESVIVGLADPLNAALMLATGGLAKPIGVLGRNLVINAASAAASAPQRIKERQDLNLKDEAINIVGGAVGSTALHVGLKLALGGYSRGPQFTRQADVYTQQKMLETAIAQHEMGAKVDMTASTIEMQRRASGQAEGTPTTYEFNPVEHPSDRTYYVAVAPESGSPVELESFGPGIHASDNGMVANNLASAPESPNTGSVQEIKIQDGAKFLDLDQPLPASLPKPYTYERNGNPTEGTVFHHGTKSDLSALSEANPTGTSSVKNLFGNGLYLTDNPNVAASYAGSKGKVLSGKLGGVKLVDLENPLPKEVFDAIARSAPNGHISAGRDLPGRDVFQALRDAHSENETFQSEMHGVYQEINSDLQKLGYDGLSHEGGTQVGGKGKHNVVVLFDDPYTNKIDGSHLTDFVPREVSARELITAMQSSDPAGLRALIKSAGYDGYKYVQNSNGASDNRLFLFSPDKADLGEEFKANKDVTPRMSVEESQAHVDRTLDPSNSQLYQPGLDEKISAAQKQPSLLPDQETTEAKQAFTNHMAFLKEIEAQDPSLASDPAYKELTRMHAQGKQESAIAKALADCMTGEFDESVPS